MGVSVCISSSYCPQITSSIVVEAIKKFAGFDSRVLELFEGHHLYTGDYELNSKLN